MANLQLTNILSTRYGNTFTLLDAVSDPLICENVEKFYVPEVKTGTSIFIKKDESIAITSSGPKRIRFIYLNANGKNMTSPDLSYIQIAPNCTGFLARLSVSRNNFTGASLELDYIIDISKISYRIDRTIMANESEILSKDVLKFKNIDFNDYSKINFDSMIKEFELHKDDIFQEFFK